MAGYTLWFAYHFKTLDPLQGRSRLYAFAEDCQGHGFEYFENYNERIEPPRVRGLIDREMDRSLAQQKPGASFFFRKNGFGMHLGASPPEQDYLVILTDSKEFPRDEALKLERVRYMVEFCELAYLAFSPDYAYGVTSPELETLDSLGGNIHPDTVYDYNFFGPGLVEELGEERILACPAMRTVRFPDGGILLELTQDTVEYRYLERQRYFDTGRILGLRRMNPMWGG